MAKIDILGVKIDNLSLQEVLEKIKSFIASENQNYIVTPNPEFIVAAQTDNQFKQILNFADIAVPDGVGIVYAAKFLHKKNIQRITGVDLVWYICEEANEQGWEIFLLGGDEGVAQKAAEVLKNVFPDIKIVGATSGGEISDPTKENYALTNTINESKAKIILVAFGQVKQEKWIFAHLDKLKKIKIAIGVGGTLDYISGEAKRAPEFIRKLGLEWLHRLINEPKRYKRIFNATFTFSSLVIKKRLFARESQEQNEESS